MVSLFALIIDSCRISLMLDSFLSLCLLGIGVRVYLGSYLGTSLQAVMALLVVCRKISRILNGSNLNLFVNLSMSLGASIIRGSVFVALSQVLTMSVLLLWCLAGIDLTKLPEVCMALLLVDWPASVGRRSSF